MKNGYALDYIVKCIHPTIILILSFVEGMNQCMLENALYSYIQSKYCKTMFNSFQKLFALSSISVSLYQLYANKPIPLTRQSILENIVISCMFQRCFFPVSRLFKFSSFNISASLGLQPAGHLCRLQLASSQPPGQPIH